MLFLLLLLILPASLVFGAEQTPHDLFSHVPDDIIIETATWLTRSIQDETDISNVARVNKRFWRILTHEETIASLSQILALTCAVDQDLAQVALGLPNKQWRKSLMEDKIPWIERNPELAFVAAKYAARKLAFSSRIKQMAEFHIHHIQTEQDHPIDGIQLADGSIIVLHDGYSSWSELPIPTGITLPARNCITLMRSASNPSPIRRFHMGSVPFSGIEKQTETQFLFFNSGSKGIVRMVLREQPLPRIRGQELGNTYDIKRDTTFGTTNGTLDTACDTIRVRPDGSLKIFHAQEVIVYDADGKKIIE